MRLQVDGGLEKTEMRLKEWRITNPALLLNKDVINAMCNNTIRILSTIEKLRANGIDSGYVVDLGCGTGKLTTLLADAGYDMIGIDNSFDMLDMALEREDDRILYLMQDMREFEPGEKVSAVVSACDSINYILEPEDLQAVFFCVSESLKEGGIFIFDVNTPYKYEVLMA